MSADFEDHQVLLLLRERLRARERFFSKKKSDYVHERSDDYIQTVFNS